MRTRNDSCVKTAASYAIVAVLVLLLGACGSGGSSPVDNRSFEVEFTRGPLEYSVQASLELSAPEPVESVTFTVRTKPGNLSKDIRVTYARTFLIRKGALDEARGTLQFTVFGLYRASDNDVLIEVNFPTSPSLMRAFVIDEGPPPDPADIIPPPFEIEQVADGLDMDFMSIQRRTRTVVVDIDGEIRWTTPPLAEVIFARLNTPEGVVLGSLNSNDIYRVDWFGRVEEFKMSDPLCLSSHHNIEPGKTGLLNTVYWSDGVQDRPESVVAEMTPEGVVTKLWDFDQIFADHIVAGGEDPTSFVQNGIDWFHNNSAIYDASDDSIIASSRENFVVKVDYQTGAIKWILGNPGKMWFTDFPVTLQPLALTIVGDPPIGQHALSVSADGTLLTVFNNGLGNRVLPHVGDDLIFSKASVYRIDAEARTAHEVQSIGDGLNIFSRVCSSAYRTVAGDMLLTFAAPPDFGSPYIYVVDDAGDILFQARAVGEGYSAAYAVEEIVLNGAIIK